MTIKASVYERNTDISVSCSNMQSTRIKYQAEDIYHLTTVCSSEHDLL